MGAHPSGARRRAGPLSLLTGLGAQSELEYSSRAVGQRDAPPSPGSPHSRGSLGYADEKASKGAVVGLAL